MMLKNEVGHLKKAAMFGPPGIESYLAQFYDPETSLFYDSFDVLAGQKEFMELADLLDSLGIEVYDLKSAYAATLHDSELSPEELISKLIDKVPQAEALILEELLNIDIAQYGKAQAIALNDKLSLEHRVPLGNIFFARDQSTVIDDTCVLGNMKFPVRKPEVDIIHAALQELGYENFLQVKQDSFEGGDLMVIEGSIYIANGMRSGKQAVKQIKDYFGHKRTYVVKIPQAGSWNKDMEIMHLDTFFMPVKKGLAVGCKEILCKCTVVDTATGDESTFLEHMANIGYTVYDIPKQEQKQYAANMLVVEPGTVIIPSDYNHKTKAILDQQGVKTYSAQLSHLTKAMGATHCMVLQIEKGDAKLVN